MLRQWGVKREGRAYLANSAASIVAQKLMHLERGMQNRKSVLPRRKKCSTQHIYRPVYGITAVVTLRTGLRGARHQRSA
jgi:hypothetical protein